MRFAAKSLCFALLGLLAQVPEAATKNHLEEYCQDSMLKLDEEVWLDLGETPTYLHVLPSRNLNGIFNTRARFQLKSQAAAAGGWWDTAVHFDFPRVNGLSLPYNVYAVSVEIPSEGFSYFHDFTDNCSSPGPSLYPGQSIDAPATQLPRLPAGAPKQRARIKVWGHL